MVRFQPGLGDDGGKLNAFQVISLCGRLPALRKTFSDRMKTTDFLTKTLFLPLQKIFVFYKCPFVKYTGTCISYLIFILLYSYVTLFGFRYEYKTEEVFLYVWMAILILDEFREVTFK